MDKTIKTKNTKKDIRILDKSAVVGKNIRHNYVRMKNNTEHNQKNEHSPVDYAESNIENAVKTTLYKTAGQVKKYRGNVKRASQNRKYNINKGEEFTQPFKSIDKTIKNTGYKFNTRKNVNKTVKEAHKLSGKTVKTAENTARVSVKTSKQAAKTSKRTAKAAQNSYRISREVSKKAVKTAKTTIKATVKSVTAAVKSSASLLVAAGPMVILMILIIILFGGILSFVNDDSSGTSNRISSQVQNYDMVIQKYAKQYGISEFTELIKAVMMQESGGQGTDPMQASECSYNTKFPNKPNGITDPEYSINVGIQNLAACLKAAGAENPIDMQNIQLALQGYNFGNGYISWAKEHGGYSAANAIEFSNMMAKKLGWASYGDINYVNNVLRYYPFRSVPLGIGSDKIVQIALTQDGNSGGKPYWSWYGCSSRIEWCACFVSWCADQCGYIDSGMIPKFSYCPAGVDWFKSKNAWQNGSYTPKPGDIIFFDWDYNNISDHVGIVVKEENGRVYTIEGNSNDMCKQNSYETGGSVILGYGTPKY